MAKEHLRGEQLEMFMPAHRLMDIESGDTAVTSEGDQQSLNEDYNMYETKLNEAKSGHIRDARVESDNPKFTLYSSIKKHGITNPVSIGWTYDGRHTIWDGNHRVASAYDIDPNTEVPVTYTLARDWMS